MKRCWLVCLLLLLSLPVRADGPVSVQILTPRAGVTLRVLLLQPAAPPVASVLLLSGGKGLLGLHDDGSIDNDGNFLVRTREAWRARGLQVAIVDSPSDQPDGMDNDFRQSAEHASDLAAVVALLRQRAAVPVWLVGTSRGTTSAAAAALQLGKQVDGLVLTSSILLGNGRLTALPLGQLTLPVLLVHHREDGCKVTPFAEIGTLQAALTHATVKALLVEEGGQGRGDPCQPWGHHGYNGIEDQVVGQIAGWIRAPAAN